MSGALQDVEKTAMENIRLVFDFKQRAGGAVLSAAAGEATVIIAPYEGSSADGIAAAADVVVDVAKSTVTASVSGGVTAARYLMTATAATVADGDTPAQTLQISRVLQIRQVI